MGKKKAQKTKELSVAIGEASSTGDETGQKQSQPQTPRKRGRPRKMVEKTEGEEEKKEDAIQQSAASVAAEESAGKPLKKSKSSEEEWHGCQQVDSSACMRFTKEEGVSQEKQLPKGESSRSRRARRKSKPRKSS